MAAEEDKVLTVLLDGGRWLNNCRALSLCCGVRASWRREVSERGFDPPFGLLCATLGEGDSGTARRLSRKLSLARGWGGLGSQGLEDEVRRWLERRQHQRPAEAQGASAGDVDGGGRWLSLALAEPRGLGVRELAERMRWVLDDGRGSRADEEEEEKWPPGRYRGTGTSAVEENDCPVNCVAVHGLSLACSGGTDNKLRCWDFSSGAPVARWAASAGKGGFGVSCVSFSPDGALVACGAQDSDVWVHAAADGGFVRALRGHTASIYALAFSAEALASGGADRTVRLWNSTTWAPTHQLMVGHGVMGLAFGGGVLASGCGDGATRLFCAATGAPARTLQGHRETVFSVAFSADGEVVASACVDGAIKLFNARTGAQLWTLFDHSEMVRCVCFSHDGKLLASASDDETVRVWHLEGGLGVPAVAETLEGHAQGVSSVCFNADSSAVVTGSYDGTVRVWDVAGLGGAGVGGVGG